MLTLLVELIIVGLATYRVTSLITSERGPWTVLARTRDWVDPPLDASRLASVRYELYELITCPWCLGLWVAPAMWALGAFVAWEIPAVIGAATVALVVWGYLDRQR